LKTLGKGSVRGMATSRKECLNPHIAAIVYKKHEKKNEKNGGCAIFQHIPRLFMAL